MSKELVVSSTPHQTRLALLEDDRLVEVYVERESHQGGLAGSIHKGRVTRVLPGMQSAFVDIGLERDAFLYVSDFFEDLDEDEEPAGDKKTRPTVATVGPSPEPPPETESSADRPRRRERGDRRGRRGRRGRPARRPESGFPQSKYAKVDDDGAPGSAEEPPEVEQVEPTALQAAAGPASVPVAETVAQPKEDLAVLPGESLAKYSDVAGRDNGEPLAELEPESAAGEMPAEGEEPMAAPEPAKEPADWPARVDLVEGDAGQLAMDVGQVAPDPPASGNGGSEGAFEGAAVAAAPVPEPEPVSVEETADEPVDAVDPELLADDASVLAAVTAIDSQEESPEDSVETLEEASPSTGDGSEALAEAVDDALTEQAGEPAEADAENSDTIEPVAATEAARSADTDGEAHPAPGLPLPDDNEVPTPETASVRERTGSSRSLRRRGRGGRRRAGRRNEPATVEASAQEASAAAPPVDGASASRDGTAQSGPTSISDLLSKGNEILAQIAKEPLGKKGARITSHIALPGRFLVYMPTVDHVGVSRKIASFDERRRLRTIVKEHCTGMPGGFIVRTAGDGIEEEEIRGDMLFLYNLWLDIRQKAEHRTGPGLVHQDLDIVERVLRDQLDEDFKTIWVDHEDEYERILRFVERFQSRLVSRVKLYTRPRPMFDEFNISKEIEKALRPKVWLKSGGYIVINQTEALVAIDVNTGKYVGKSDRLEDTIVNTNLEAANEIVRQMRLRDLGGIVVVDFIDMEDRKNRASVIQALETALRRDPAPSKSLPFNEFGLVAITRKRVKQSLERTLCSPCSACAGSGLLKSVESVIYEIMDEAREMSPDMKPQKDVTLRVNPDVARTLKSRKNRYLQEIEELLKSHVLVRSDLSLQREHFDIN